MRLVLALLAGLLPGSALAGLLDSGFTAEYDVYVSGIYAGTSSRHLESRDGHLIYRARTEPRGLAQLFFPDIVTEISRMQRQGPQLRPLEYRYDQTGKEEVHEVVKFDWGKRELFLSREAQTYPLQDDTYDILSFQLAMMLALESQRRQFVFHVASHRRLYTYDAAVSGRETIETEYGELETIRVDARSRPDGSRRFRFWCAPRLDYLPVRIEFVREDKGTRSLSEIRTLRIRDEGRGTSGGEKASP